MSTTKAQAKVAFLELELTRSCPLQCAHCYSDSGPTGSHGTMTTPQWETVITDAKALGVETVQLIGGEPSFHPDFEHLLRYAIAVGLQVEVFTNLFRVKEAWWELFTHPAVSLATSYYSDTAAGHEAVTGRRGSHSRTRTNIAEAVRRRIPLRVGIIDVLDGQRVAEAEADLRALGVTAIGTDRMRGIGRAATARCDVAELCGRCGRGKAAISTGGDVWPCVMSRWMRAGNVREQPLAQILEGATMTELVAAIPAPRAGCAPEDGACKPGQELCGPDYCEPDVQGQ
jgi:MoaA/NifB/PqqE/SkfB family radical SAM enzyme